MLVHVCLPSLHLLLLMMFMLMLCLQSLLLPLARVLCCLHGVLEGTVQVHSRQC